MKRSEINAILKNAIDFLAEMRFLLPPYAYFTPEQWKVKINDPEYLELRENSLGWDITDFGSGDFEKVGLFLFTVRNGNYHNSKYVKPYAEKIMIAGEGQVTPCHFHANKMEDIINRGGGNLLVQLYNRTEDNQLADTAVTVNSDGRTYIVPAGTIVRLTPGESITLCSGQYHSFWGEPGFGKVLIGEVSKVNDDRTDNHFFTPVGRFPAIEEDEAPLYLLAQEYAI